MTWALVHWAIWKPPSPLPERCLDPGGLAVPHGHVVGGLGVDPVTGILQRGKVGEQTVLDKDVVATGIEGDPEITAMGDLAPGDGDVGEDPVRVETGVAGITDSEIPEGAPSQTRHHHGFPTSERIVTDQGEAL